VAEGQGDEEQTFRGDADRLLGPSLDPTRYPLLAEVLATPNASAFRLELMQLFGPLVRARAPRRSLRAMCRLEGPGYDEPVLVKNISATGVRFLVQSDATLDLTRFSKMSLHVRIKAGPRTMAVALVRRCGGDQRHTDLACRFLSPTPDHLQVVAEIRSRICAEATLPAEAIT